MPLFLKPKIGRRVEQELVQELVGERVVLVGEPPRLPPGGNKRVDVCKEGQRYLTTRVHQVEEAIEGAGEEFREKLLALMAEDLRRGEEGAASEMAGRAAEAAAEAFLKLVQLEIVSLCLTSGAIQPVTVESHGDCSGGWGVEVPSFASGFPALPVLEKVCLKCQRVVSCRPSSPDIFEVDPKIVVDMALAGGTQTVVRERWKRVVEKLEEERGAVVLCPPPKGKKGVAIQLPPEKNIREEIGGTMLKIRNDCLSAIGLTTGVENVQEYRGFLRNLGYELRKYLRLEDVLFVAQPQLEKGPGAFSIVSHKSPVNGRDCPNHHGTLILGEGWRLYVKCQECGAEEPWTY